MNNVDCIAIVSGGIDSVTMLYSLVKEKRRKPYVISFDYGQRASKEIDMTRWHCEKLGLEFDLIELPMKDILSNSALMQSDADLPNSDSKKESKKVTVVPARNLIMLSVVVGLAENNGIKEVYYAAHADDEEVYPDCRKEFVMSLSTTSYLATYTGVEIKAPFVEKYKSDIVRKGLILNVPFEMTWTCYKGGEKACGKCSSCQERIEAFKKNGAMDPVEYEIEVTW